MAIATFARLTLHEAVRNRLLQLAFGLTLVFFALLAWGARYIRDTFPSPTLRHWNAAILVILALYLGSFLLAVLAVFAAGHSTRHESESGLLHAVVAKPVRRSDLLAGRWLGAALFLLAYAAFFTAGVVLIVGQTTGYYPPDPAPAVALLWIEALVMLGLRLLFGTFLGSLVSGIVPLMLYGLAWTGGLVEYFGGLFDAPPLVKVGVLTSLLIPTDVLWRGASYYLQPVALLAVSERARGIPFVSAVPLTPPMLVWAALYAAGLFPLAAWIFARRDV